MKRNLPKVLDLDLKNSGNMLIQGQLALLSWFPLMVVQYIPMLKWLLISNVFTCEDTADIPTIGSPLLDD